MVKKRPKTAEINTSLLTSTWWIVNQRDRQAGGWIWGWNPRSKVAKTEPKHREYKSTSIKCIPFHAYVVAGRVLLNYRGFVTMNSLSSLRIWASSSNKCLLDTPNAGQDKSQFCSQKPSICSRNNSLHESPVTIERQSWSIPQVCLIVYKDGLK